MTYFYGPDKLKPVCQLCKYTLGAPVWVASTITDQFMSTVEEKYFHEEVPIDIPSTNRRNERIYKKNILRKL